MSTTTSTTTSQSTTSRPSPPPKKEITFIHALHKQQRAFIHHKQQRTFIHPHTTPEYNPSHPLYNNSDSFQPFMYIQATPEPPVYLGSPVGGCGSDRRPGPCRWQPEPAPTRTQPRPLNRIVLVHQITLPQLPACIQWCQGTVMKILKEAQTFVVVHIKWDKKCLREGQ